MDGFFVPPFIGNGTYINRMQNFQELLSLTWRTLMQDFLLSIAVPLSDNVIYCN